MKEEYLRKSDPDILRPGSRLPAEGSVRRPRASAIKLYEIRVYKVNVFSKVSENFSFYPLRPHAARAPEESRVLLRADPEALAGYRGQAVNPKPREAEFSAAGVFFRFYGQGLSLEKSCGAGGFSGSCAPAENSRAVSFPAVSEPGGKGASGAAPEYRITSRDGRETQVSLPEKCLYRKAGDSELQSSGLPHKGQTSFTEYPGKRLGISSSRGCPIRHRFLSRRTL